MPARPFPDDPAAPRRPLGARLRSATSTVARLRLAAVALLAAACSDSTGPGAGDGRVARVEVSPARTSLGSGQVAQLQVVARAADGTEVRGRPATWTVSDALVAALEADGRLTARGHGTARITATVDGVAGSAEVTVAANPAPRIESGSPGSVRTGAGPVTVTLRGTGFARGAVVRLNGADRPTEHVSWTELRATLGAEDVAQATIAAITVFTPAPGGGTSNAVTFAVSDIPVHSVSIAPAAPTVAQGQAVQLVATLRSEPGAVIPGRPTTWTSSAEGIATVSPSGLVTGVARGTATITATSEGKSASVTVTVGAPTTVPVIRALTPAIAVAGDGATEVRVSGWNFEEGTVATWNGEPRPTRVLSAETLVLTLPAADLAATGTGRIAVRTGATASGTLDFAISAGPTSVVVEGGRTLWGSEVQQLTAVVRDAQGRTLPGRTVTWESSDANVALVDRAGLVLGVADGAVEVRARVGTLTGRTRFLVSARPAQSLLYVIRRGTATTLAVVRPGDTEPPTLLFADGRFAIHPAVSPDGRRIAYAGRDAQGNIDVYVVNRDGSDVRRLTTTPGTDDQPAWSPDGTRLAFRSERSGSVQVWTMQADGSAPRQVTGLEPTFGDVQAQDPAWLTDSRLVYSSFAATVAPLRGVLMTIRDDGTSAQLLGARDGFSDSGPAVSPDGRTIAVARRQLGTNTWRIVLIGLDGREVVLVHPPGAGTRPRWSADGQWLAYEDPNGEVVVSRLNTEVERRITEGAAAGGGATPVWVSR